MPGKDGSAQLSVEIANLKKELNLAFKNQKSLTHPEIMAISMLLDEKIVQYMRIKNNKEPENDELKEMTPVYST